ncbi:hypothetical protein J437_LFUL017614 [Ladona fulva]|uniref:Pre-C2HC domain-containing protein n=1 Tax=Ladona fulva TaxID=123851 RepID=A0A8K0P6Q7_LADFU|nr:hypothetical protein J437_LFUL017614 [Ladona fulva]
MTSKPPERGGCTTMEKKEETDRSSENSDTTMEDDCSSVTSTTIEDIINQDNPELAMDQLLQGLTFLRERIPDQKWKASIQKKLASGNFNTTPSVTQPSLNAVTNVIPSTSGNNDNLNSVNVNNDNVNNEGFKVVNHKRKYSAVNKNPSPEPIPLNNCFDPIQNSYTPAPIQPSTSQPTPVYANPTVKKIKILSIKVNYDQSWPNILNGIIKTTNLPPVCQLAGPKTILIKNQTVDDYTKCLHHLKATNVEYFTYQLPNQRNMDFVIRSLPSNTSPTAIQDALTSKGIPVISANQIFTTRPTTEERLEGKTTGEKLPCPIFRITAEHIEDPNIIKNITSLFHLRVSIADYIKPKEPVQCMRCQ